MLLLSVGGLALALPTAAQAACSPDPTLAGGTTICTDVDSDGLAVATAQTTVRVAAGATVGGATARPIASTAADTRILVDGTVDGRSMAPSGAAIQFGAARPRAEISATGSILGRDAAIRYAPGAPGTVTIDNAGRIEATTAAIQLQTSPVASLSLTNRAGAVIRGAVAIASIPPAAFSGDLANIALLDNAGTVAGSDGRAIDLTGFFATQRGSLSSLINRAGGRIEGELVVGNLGQFTNAGVMDGGTRSVLALPSQAFNAWLNSGTITSRRTDGATVAASGFNLSNSGTISNTGGGAAAATTGGGSLSNLANGVISSSGPTAIMMGSGSTFDNAGRVVGDVEFTAAAGNDRVFQRGIIQGSVRLGGGDDIFLVDAGAGLTGTGVTGSVDGGAGNDAFGYTTSGVASVVVGALPATFERYILEAAGTDAVLSASGTIGSAPLSTQGSGTVVSALNITATGEVALQAGAATTINRGTVDFTGASMSTTQRRAAFGGGRVVNEGTVIARGLRSVVSSSTVAPENRGTIRLLDGAALVSTGAIVNFGTIELASASSQLFSREFGTGQSNLDNRGLITAVGSAYVSDATTSFVTISNSGTIRSATRAIDFTPRTAGSGSATIDNRAGGTIEGAQAAILGGAGIETVTNAGRIIGTVDLGAGNDSFLSAGRLEGDLRLGDGNDVYLIDVAVPGIVTGTIDAGAGIDTRRLLARSDTIVDVAADSRFEITDLLVSGTASSADRRPVVTNRTSLVAAAPGTAVSVTGNVAFTNAAALSASGAGASAIRSGASGAGLPTVTNDGAITIGDGAVGARVDGGYLVNRAAITGTGIGVTLSNSRFDNAGRVVTTGAAVQVAGGLSRVTNSGTLESSTGPAVVNSSNSSTFRNLEGGVVRGAGGVAYQGSGSAETVQNAGRFVGDVVLGTGNDVYQFAGGTIEGRLLLGAGSDRVDVGLRGLDVVLATGGVDAGEGTDIYAFSVDSSRSLNLAPVSGFEGLAINTIGTATEVTLAAAPAGAAALDILLEAGGTGTIVNDRALTRTGGSVVQTAGTARFLNRATIEIASTDQSGTVVGINAAATVVGDAPGVVNTGLVRANGASAVGVFASSTGPSDESITVLNSGTVSATGAAFGIVATAGTVRNAGTVTADATSRALVVSNRLINDGTVSSAGLGASLAASGIEGARLTNAGTITAGGAAVEVSDSGRIVNSGRLQSTGGAAVRLVSNSSVQTGRVINEAGGVIAGNGDAIVANQAVTARVVNRGTIAGSVIFASGTAGTVGIGDLYVADGGRVLGDVRFGASNDLFVTSLAQATTPGASISGVLDMGGGEDTLRLRADSSAAATILASAAGFERLSYEAAGRGTVLTLTSPVSRGLLDLAGDGTVDLTADLQTVGTALTLSAATASLYAEPTAPIAPGLRVISRGTITSAATGTSQPAAVALTSGARFENLGAIRLTQDPDTFVARSAISGGSATVVNGGRIELNDGNIGVTASAVVNSGTIEQLAGLGATGVSNSRSLDNSGTIRAGTAVFANGIRVTNSGTLEGLGGVAIAGSALIVNTATGRIVGRPGNAAIGGGSGSDALINAGTVAGNVDLGGGNDLFIAAGGRIDGSVSLGAGDDSYLVRGDASVPTGGVSNGGGRDAFGRSFVATASYALEKPADYDLHAVEAAGATTTVTVTAPNAIDTGLRVFGTGTVENRAVIGLTGDFASAGAAQAAVELRRVGVTPDDATLQFVNRASLTSTGVGVRSFGDEYVGAGFARFENAATIDARYQAVDLRAETRTDGVSVVNGGSLKSAEGSSALQLDISLRASDVDATRLPAVELTNSGTIVNVATTAFAAGAQVNAEGAALRVTNSGTIDAAAEKGTGLEIATSQLTLINSGRLVASGNGADALHVELSRVNAGSTTPALPPSTITNDGTIQSNASAAYAGFTVSSGELVAAATAATITSSGAVELRNGATGVIEATGARSGAILFGSLDAAMRAGFTLTNAGVIRGTGLVLADSETFLGGTGLGTDRALAGAIHSVDSIDAITNATGGRIFGGINLGAGDDSLENFGRIEGSIQLGAGNDRMVQALAGTLVGSADGGEGTDALVFDIAGGGTIDFRQFTGFETIAQRGRGAVTFAGLDPAAPLPIATFELADTGFSLAAGQTFTTRGATTLTGSAGAETVVNAGTIGGSIDLGGGDDSVTNSGRIVGSVQLGAGNDRYTTNGVATVGGPIDGGDGTDTLEFAVAGTPAAPTVWNGSGTTAFETLLLSQGTLSLTGSTPAFGTFNVAGGYFVGQAGSVLTAAAINVAPGAIFGSAGRVVGNVVVGGTLSPGASPGTMTIAGNLALAPGSTTLFEITPTASDLLLVSGSTTIGANTTLTLTGTRAGSATPLDLIVSDGGITGSFATVNKDAALIGFLAQRGNRLQLIGQFATDPAAPAPTRAAIDYVNAALTAGQISPALAAALPSLLTPTGAAAVDRFAELTPETYATAASYGASRALRLADTVRDAAVGRGDGAGSFVFATGVAEWTDADGGVAASADFETHGVVGGIGHRFESGSSVAGFVGSLGGEARTDALRARSTVDGIVFGVHGKLVSGAASFDATLAYDAAKAKLSRSVAADASSPRSRFDLNGLVGDLSASYRVDLGSDWRLSPRLGVTYVSIDRDGSSEGPGALALTVAGDRDARWFGNLGAEARRVVGSVQPFAHAGLRYRIAGDEAVAAAQFGGVTIAPLRAVGAELGRTVAVAGGGANVDLSSTVSLRGAYEATLGDRDSHAVTLGLSAAF